MIKTEVRPIAGFEEDYARYIARKENVIGEIETEREKEIAEINKKYDLALEERTATIDKLIALTSETVEFEVADPEPVVEEVVVEEAEPTIAVAEV